MEISEASPLGRSILLCAAACLMIASRPALAVPAFEADAVGLKYGVGGSQSSRDFMEAQVFGKFNLPWRLDFGKGFGLQTVAEADAGMIGEHSLDGWRFELGPDFRLGRRDFPLFFEFGSNATYLTRTEFATKDFGGSFQFTSHAGFALDLPWHLRIGYRFEHMSNAGLYSLNPGLNMHVFSLSYRFR